MPGLFDSMFILGNDNVRSSDYKMSSFIFFPLPNDLKNLTYLTIAGKSFCIKVGGSCEFIGSKLGGVLKSLLSKKCLPVITEFMYVFKIIFQNLIE